MKTRGRPTDALVELVDMYPDPLRIGRHPASRSSGRTQLRTPARRSEAAVEEGRLQPVPQPGPARVGRQPAIAGHAGNLLWAADQEVEQRIIRQQGDTWDRELFENHLMGYTMRTDRYRLVVWRDRRDPQAEPVFVELYDHATDPQETENIARAHPQIVSRLTEQLRDGWKAAL